MEIRRRYRDEFEQIGPIDVRARIRAGLYDDDKRKQAYAWLDETERGEDRALMRSQARDARSAKRAAWIAAITAIVAAIIATISIPTVQSWISALISCGFRQ